MKDSIKRGMLNTLKEWYTMVEEDKCDFETLNKATEIASRELDVKMTSAEAMKTFGISKSSFYNGIHRKMPKDGIFRNIVKYSASQLYKIFGIKK